MRNTRNSSRPRGGNHFVQLAVASSVMLAGVTLLVAGFILPPAGEIHPSVLVGFGEALTFTAAILGVDYHYKNRVG